jgi:hypothetical protein
LQQYVKARHSKFGCAHENNAQCVHGNCSVKFRKARRMFNVKKYRRLSLNVI